MIKIDLKLLNRFFLQKSRHNVLWNILKKKDIVLSKKDMDKGLKYLEEIIDFNKPYSGLYTINNTKDLIRYIFEFVYHDFKVYRINFTTKSEFILFLYIVSILFLTLFSPDAMKTLKNLPSRVQAKIKDELKNIIDSYIDSRDVRGLIFYFCKKYDLPYDYLLQDEVIQYEYSAPAINKQWQKLYKHSEQPILFWFYNSVIGRSLFLVLYTPRCRYKTQKGGCSGCNLPTVSSTSKKLNTQDVLSQIDNTFEANLSVGEKDSIQELMLSNNGSILDPKTMDTESLKYAVIKAVEELPNLKKIIFETRIDDYTNIKQLKIIQEMLKEHSIDIMLEIAIGFEIFNDKLRNGYYKKGLKISILEEKMILLSALDISLKVYMMYKPVPNSLMSVDEAIFDLNAAVKYFSTFVESHKLNINLHISPTYLATGTPLYKAYKENKYTPPSNKDIERMYNSLDLKENLSYYISMNDEGLGADIMDDMEYSDYISLKEKIYEFNIDNYRFNE